MNTLHFTAGMSEHPVSVVVTRVAEQQWHALADDVVIGRGDIWLRPDGRTFLSIDSWHDSVFDQLADTMLAELPRPLYTVIDEADYDSLANWERVGFAARRREWGYIVPTDPQIAGLEELQAPSGVTIVPAGEAEEGPLRALDHIIRAEVESGLGWQAMPVEVPPRPHGTSVADPSKYAVAVHCDQYAGLVRVAPMTRQPRIGLIAVRADLHRRGRASALPDPTLDMLHH
jgi:hypothetical protein